ncbi:DUF397 domain-containing protein [Streptomyces sp. PRKS01-29]|nr:DUF397 domain-containing protein [Streptomyces sabulosicollis]
MSLAVQPFITRSFAVCRVCRGLRYAPVAPASGDSLRAGRRRCEACGKRIDSTSQRRSRRWRGSATGSAAEHRDLPVGRQAVRATKDRERGAPLFEPSAWQAFVNAARDGEFGDWTSPGLLGSVGCGAVSRLRRN